MPVARQSRFLGISRFSHALRAPGWKACSAATTLSGATRFLSRMPWNRLCRATGIAPGGVTPQAARGVPSLTMNIIILGAGRVGESVAESLVSEQNDITVIDMDPARLRSLEERIDLRGVVGNGIQPTMC